MKKIIPIALGIFSLAYLPSYANAEEATDPVIKIEKQEDAIQKTEPSKQKQPEKTQVTTVKNGKVAKTEKLSEEAEEEGEAMKHRGFQPSETTVVPNKKPKSHYQCTNPHPGPNEEEYGGLDCL